jgi:outer membrane protein assembly factor BamD
MNSFEVLKEERLNTAKEAYDTFRKQYPESAFDDKAADLLNKIEKELQNYTEEAPQETK